MIASIVAAMVLTVPAQVELRGQPGRSAGEVIDVSLDGVRVRDHSGRTVVLGWDRVRAVGGDFALDAEPYAHEADKAWRARTRLLRGDALAAEPLFEDLFLMYEGRTGPTAAMVAEGLLRCRLRRGVQTSAVAPWLALVRAKTDGQPAIPEAQPVIDAATGLAPMLPPIWLDGPATRAFALVPEPDVPESGRDRAEALRAWYRHAARFESGLSERPPSLPPSQDVGLMLVSRVVLARTGNASERSSSRQWLNDHASRSMETWQEAWCRAAIGRSLVREAGEDQRRLGVVALLHVPARFEREHPFLAGVCLAEAAHTMRGLGDEASARRLMHDLAQRFPGHPALAWDKTSDLVPRSTGAPGRSESVMFDRGWMESQVAAAVAEKKR
ncbi:MAG: hypothetical protein KF866_01720 [Phycisphaeraceae bacterium]|nr:hypothetical protein [Phycisphaeraceae bacterium]MCW5753589.1 hypothetical protein [Phycisphaeraceae bacterium]